MSRQLNLACLEGSEIATLTVVAGKKVKPRSPKRPQFRAQSRSNLLRFVRLAKIPAKARVSRCSNNSDGGSSLTSPLPIPEAVAERRLGVRPPGPADFACDWRQHGIANRREGELIS